MALPTGWVTPTGVPQDIQDRVLQSYNQYWDPYNQARMVEEGSNWNIGAATGQKPWNYGFSTEGLSPEAMAWLGDQAGNPEFANVDPFASDWGRSKWMAPKSEGFLDSGMGWLVPLGLAASVAGLQGAGLWGGTGAQAAGTEALGTGLKLGASGQGLTYGAGGAAGLSPSAAATGMGWGAGGVGASLPWAESLGRGLSFDAGGETGLTYGAGGETGLTAPQSWGSFPEWSSGTGEFSGGSLGTGLKPGGGTGFAPNGGTGLKIPGLNAPSTYTPGGWLEKGSKMLEDYFMPKGELSLSRLLNPVSSIASGFMQSRASKDAALEQVRAAQQALQMLGGQNAAGQAALAPYQQAGTAMLSDLTAGLSPGGRYTQGFSGVDFQNDPGYMSQLEEGMRAIQGSAASKGLLKSGATAKALTKYGQDLASRTYNDAYNRWRQQQADDYNRRANLAGLGQTTANQLTSFGNQNAQTLASLLGSQASAAGAGAIGSANAWTGALSNLLGSVSQQSILDALRRAGVI